MAKEPWFKLYAADYLLDSNVDSLPLEARSVLLSMWCLCHIDGYCPGEPEEIARKTRLCSSSVAKYQDQLSRFFEMRDDRLYSRRMEAEKLKSETGRMNANKRWRPNASSNANGNAECNAQSQSQSQSQSQDQIQNQSQIQKNPPSLENQFSHSKEKQQLSQKDFDARDLHKFNDAGKKLTFKLQNGWGYGLSQEQIFVEQCLEAGVLPDQMREVFARVDESEASA